MGNIENYFNDIDNKTWKTKKIKYLTNKDEMIKFIWLNLIYKIDRKRFIDFFWKDILVLFYD